MGEESVGDSIKDSDRGDKHWIIREDVPWQSPIAEVQEYCETEIPGKKGTFYFFRGNSRRQAFPATQSACRSFRVPRSEFRV